MAVFILIFAVILSEQVVAATKITSQTPLIILRGNDRDSTYPSTEELNVALQKFRDNVPLYQDLLNTSMHTSSVWRRDMVTALPTSTWLILHSSVHLPGGTTTLVINFELDLQLNLPHDRDLLTLDQLL